MANIDDSDELKERPERIVNAGEPDSDTWRIIGAIAAGSVSGRATPTNASNERRIPF